MKNNKPVTVNHLPFLIGLSALLYCILNGVSRRFFNGNTESDFLVSYIGEATRILNGNPPLVSHHPPFYPYLIAFIQHFSGHWLATGLLITFFSLAGCLLLNFMLFRDLFGKPAAAGTLTAFLVSPIFLAYSSMATSDTFFLFCYTACLFLTYKALKTGSFTRWLAAGFVLGLTFLSRTNAITLLLLFAAPLFSDQKLSKKLIHFLGMAASFMFPLSLWFLYSKTHNTPFMPSETYANLAMTYFSPTSDRMSADAYVLAKANFNSLFDVVTRDPLRMLRIFILDFFTMCLRNLFLLVSPLLSLFALFGLLRLPSYKSMSRTTVAFCAFLLLSALAQTGLTNLKTYEYRYYLFWLPLLGAAAGYGIQLIAQKLNRPYVTFTSISLLIILLSLPIVIYKSFSMLHSPFQNELKTGIEAVRGKVPEKGVLIGRKSHLSYYTGHDYLFIPNSADLQDLRIDLESIREDRELYLFFGYYEAATRAQFRQLINPQTAPYWLQLIASNREKFPWNLYYVRKPTDYESELLKSKIETRKKVSLALKRELPGRLSSGEQ